MGKTWGPSRILGAEVQLRPLTGYKGCEDFCHGASVVFSQYPGSILLC